MKIRNVMGVAAALCTSAGLALTASAQCNSYTTETPSPGMFVSGAATDTGNHGDDVGTVITLPFTVNLYAGSFTTARVVSNGFIHFGTSTSNAFSNACLRGAIAGGPTIFALWDDHNTTTRVPPNGAGIFTQTTGVAPNQVFTIEWRVGDGTSGLTVAQNFALQFYEGQSFFDVFYITVGPGATDSTIGVQANSTAPASFTQFSCNPASPAVVSGSSIRFNCVAPSTGACCANDGTCSIDSDTACASPRIYAGANTTCAPGCPITVRACCSTTTGLCTFQTAACGAGTTENGTVCTPSPCPPVGTCCIGSCCSVTTQAACTGSWNASPTVCTTNPCPAPSNDLCTNAISLTIGTPINGDNCNATSTGDGPACGTSGKGVWYTFNSPAGGLYRVTTCGSNLDTVLAVFTTTDCVAFTQVVGACNDDGCTAPGSTLASNIPSLSLAAGTYHVRVASFGTTPAGGAFTLTVIELLSVGCCNPATGACTVAVTGGCGVGLVETGTGCSPNPCPQPSGACCANDGTCAVVDGANCVSPSIFLGDATLCGPSNTCSDINVGSCCNACGTVCTYVASAAACASPSTYTAGGVCNPSPCVSAAPVNDLCVNAVTASLGANSGSTTCATTDFAITPETQCGTFTGSGGGLDVWFKFTPGNSGSFTLDTCATPGFDTVLAIYDNCPADGTVAPLACNDDAGAVCAVSTLRSQIASIALASSTTYYIRVASYGGSASGAFVLNITEVIPTGTCCVGSCCSVTTQVACTGNWTLGGTCSPNPCPATANDNCANAIAISNASLPVTVMGNNCNATADGPAAICGSGGTANSVWWSFSPTHTAAYTINNCGSAFDSILTVFSGDCVTPVEIGCNDDSCGVQSQVAGLVLTAGQTYLIRVGSYSTGVGSISVTVSADSALGSCCNPSGSCSQTDAAACADVFNPGGTCTPNTCPQPTGACCCGAACLITLPGDCTGANQVFSGSGTSCTPYSATVPCCRGNYNKSAPGPGAPGGVSVQDIFDFLAAYFTNDPCANANDSVGPNNGVSVQDIFDFLAAYFGGCP